jgi:2,4-dienoyl-CoA reductase-like NADH-dependent reductase (Old Yellow Enzyme family)
MQGHPSDQQTIAREAYFLVFGEEIARLANMPVMVTGGIRRRLVAEKVLRGPVDMVGIASAMAIDPQLPMHWRNSQRTDVDVPRVHWKNKALASVTQNALIKFQLNRISRGKPVRPGISPAWVLLCSQLHTRSMTRRYRQWISASKG